ncbi:MAG: ABC transporter permease [Methylobacterium sp.]|jgi:peptide/nickel transport system permease protein|nr:ABC transporter permease [Methylobacterium sp.]MCA3619847.1 ABC transporter permease [Methylobacterium sp.]
MIRYFLGRLFSALLVLLVVSLFTFVLIWLVPGDVASQLADPGASIEELQRIRARLNLDQPWYVQMAAWYGNLLQGDLGQSFLLNRSVTTAIIERLPVTLALTALALVIAVTLGVTAGVIAAVQHGKLADQSIMVLALVGLSIPDFWLGLVGIYVFAVALGWLPSGGFVPFTESPMGWARSMALPAFTLGITQIGLIARITRSSMLDVLGQDYVRTARAKGVPAFKVVTKHAFANALIPIITVTGVIVGVLLGGAVVIEQVFSLPGVGRLIIGAVLRRDYPVIQGGLLLLAFIYVFVNIIVDLLYAYVDPRVRYG